MCIEFLFTRLILTVRFKSWYCSKIVSFNEESYLRLNASSISVKGWS